MLSLDQVKLLENKVLKAVDLINTLSDEKNALKEELNKKDERIAELENLILAFKDDQSKIEEKIINALNQLSAFEDSIYEKRQELNKENTSHQSQTPNSGNEITEIQQPVEAENNAFAEDNAPIKDKPSDNLEKDLNDVLGNSEKTEAEDQDALRHNNQLKEEIQNNKSEVNQQLDIF